MWLSVLGGFDFRLTFPKTKNINIRFCGQVEVWCWSGRVVVGIDGGRGGRPQVEPDRFGWSIGVSPSYLLDMYGKLNVRLETFLSLKN